MMTSENGKNHNGGHNGNLVWVGLGVGAAALGVALAMSRKKRDRWDAARQVSKRVADRTSDLAAASKDIVDRVRIIYGERCKVAEEATELVARGRKLAGV